MKKQQIALRQLDKQLAVWQQAKLFFQPPKGWIHTLRKVLGMTSKQLARRLDVDRSRVVKLESAEIENAVTLRTLRETAHALNCDLVYGFIPRISLQDWLKQQAELIAEKHLKTVSHSMGLEAQAVSSQEEKIQKEELVATLLQGSFKQLWEKND